MISLFGKEEIKLVFWLNPLYEITLPWPHTVPVWFADVGRFGGPRCTFITLQMLSCVGSQTDCYVVLRLPVLENSGKSLYPRLMFICFVFFPTLWCTAKYTKLQAACTFFLCNWKFIFSWVMLSVFGKEVTKLSSCLSTPLTLSTYCTGRICWCWTLWWP